MEEEIEGLDPREAICPRCNLAHWTPAGPCPTCAMERPRAPLRVVKGR